MRPMRHETGPEAPSVTPRDAVRRALAPFATVNTTRAVGDFLLDYALYFGALAGVLFLAPLWAKLLCGVFAGVKIANLATLGHDAAHGNLARSPRLNRLLGIFCFLPGLYSYQLWIYDHHHVHHPFTNGRHKDSWTPLSKQAFDRLPRHRQWLERFYRNEWGLGLAAYYIIERWWDVKFIPRAFLPRRFRAAAWRHFAYVMAWFTGLSALLAAAPAYSPTGPLVAILFGFVLPFFVWQTLFSFTVYVQHTHVNIAWFDGAIDRKEAIPIEQLSLHLAVPRWFGLIAHDVYDHAAHHVNPRIPYHRLRDAQARLNEISADHAVRQGFSFRWLHDTLRRCKLYDYEHNLWLDFDGHPTAPSPIGPAQRAVIARTPGTEFVPQA